MIPPEATVMTGLASSWMGAVREHDSGFHLHSLLVSELTSSFAAYLGFSTKDRKMLTLAGLLHDVGKLQIHADLLRKPAALSADEDRIMKLHPVLGFSMLRAEDVCDDVILAVVHDHHERLDGSGYPSGLDAGAISDPVRIVMLCDIFAAMTEPRPYTNALDWQTALAILATKEGRIDTKLLRHFAAMIYALRVDGPSSVNSFTTPAETTVNAA